LNAFYDFAVLDDFDALAIAAQQCGGRQTNKRIATETLAAHNRFQQKCIFAGVLRLSEFKVKGKRCFQIRKCLCYEWNAVIAFYG
jgi:hypothetical protein